MSAAENPDPLLTVLHGHLKSSNVLLDGAFEAVLSDFKVMVAYKSPECIVPHGKPSKKSASSRRIELPREGAACRTPTSRVGGLGRLGGAHRTGEVVLST
jgi:hypothetical protein